MPAPFYRKMTATTISAYVVLAVVTFFCLLCLYWTLYPYKTIVQTESPWAIVSPPHASGTLVHVKQDGYITYAFDYTKQTEVLPTITRQFVDGLVFNVGGSAPTILGVGSGHAQIQVRIPHTLPPGEYRLNIRTVYKMNPLREIVHDNTTQRFIVEPAFDNDLDGKVTP